MRNEEDVRGMLELQERAMAAIDVAEGTPSEDEQRIIEHDRGRIAALRWVLEEDDE